MNEMTYAEGKDLTNQQVADAIGAMLRMDVADPDAPFEVFSREGNVGAYYHVDKVTFLVAPEGHKSIIIELGDCVSTGG